MDLPPLYTFIDEGGDVTNFSPTGSRYFTLTSVTMGRPFNLAARLAELRFDLLERGTPLEYFHASEDRQAVRNEVFRVLQGGLGDVRVDSVIVEKRKTGPSLRELNRFYPEMLGYLLRYLVWNIDWKKWSELIVITDRIPHNKKREAIEKTIKETLARFLPEGTTYRVYHHASVTTYNLQVADYFNWAIYKAWSAGDHRSLDLVKPAVRSQFDIFETGTKVWY